MTYLCLGDLPNGLLKRRKCDRLTNSEIPPRFVYRVQMRSTG